MKTLRDICTIVVSKFKGEEVGHVKWFNKKDGYGFITCSDGNEVFVHYKFIETRKRKLYEGQRVAFKVDRTLKGPQARQVRPA